MSEFGPIDKAMAIVPKFTAGLSFLGSLYIMQHILRTPKKLGHSYHRTLLGMSVFDLSGSIVFFLSTWPIPVGTPGAFLASGTVQTCTAQGFFAHVSTIGTALYNAALALFYLLVFRYEYTEEQTKKVERYFHIVIPVTAISLSLPGVFLGLFNPAGWVCCFNSYPYGCKESFANGGVSTCERGDNASLYMLALLHAEVWASLAFVTCAMLSIYLKVLNNEKATAERTGTKERSKSNKVAFQAFQYVGAMYITWFFVTLTRVMEGVTGRSFWQLYMMMTIFFPLQGFFNALIYLRPRYLRYRKRNKRLSLWGCIKMEWKNMKNAGVLQYETMVVRDPNDNEGGGRPRADSDFPDAGDLGTSTLFSNDPTNSGQERFPSEMLHDIRAEAEAGSHKMSSMGPASNLEQVSSETADEIQEDAESGKTQEKVDSAESVGEQLA